MLEVAFWIVLLLGPGDAREITAAPKPHQRAEAAEEGSSDEFRKSVRPILEQRCQPCHFSGGKMFQRLPFDRPETIVKLGEKLFTRIKDEKERAAIRHFLAAGK